CASERYANARNAATLLGFAVFALMKSRKIALHRTLAVPSPSAATLARSAGSAARVGRGSDMRSAHPLNTRTATAADHATPRGSLAILLIVPPYGWAQPRQRRVITSHRSTRLAKRSESRGDN